MWLQYRGRGRWAESAFAERIYLMLSLVAKSGLAWQVYPARSPEADHSTQALRVYARGC